MKNLEVNPAIFEQQFEQGRLAAINEVDDLLKRFLYMKDLGIMPLTWDHVQIERALKTALDAVKKI